MKKVLILLLIVPSLAFCQKYEDLDSTSKAKVDSMVRRMGMIKQLKTHHKMVSFTEWSVDALKDFWSYLIYDLRFSTDQNDNSVVFTRTPTGYSTRFIKYTSGYQQKKQSIKIDFQCNKDGENTKMVTITGPINLLADIYMRYWEANVRPDFTKSGALEKTYLPGIETIWLYSDRIVIKPFKEISSY